VARYFSGALDQLAADSQVNAHVDDGPTLDQLAEDLDELGALRGRSDTARALRPSLRAPSTRAAIFARIAPTADSQVNAHHAEELGQIWTMAPPSTSHHAPKSPRRITEISRDTSRESTSAGHPKKTQGANKKAQGANHGVFGLRAPECSRQTAAISPLLPRWTHHPVASPATPPVTTPETVGKWAGLRPGHRPGEPAPVKPRFALQKPAFSSMHQPAQGAAVTIRRPVGTRNSRDTVDA
jgi:hypothetical protein